MKKIICGVVVFLGVAIIAFGVVLQLNQSNSEEEVVDTSSFERINTYSLNEVCTSYNLIETYTNTNDYKKITYNYPDCVHEYSLSYWYKYLYDDYPDNTISINVSKDNDTLNNYMNELKTKLISYRGDLYEEVEYTDVYKTTVNDLNVSLIEANVKYKGVLIDNYYDLWYIAVEIEDEQILVFEVSAKNSIMSYKSIEELFKNVVVIEDGATFTKSKTENNYQIGTLIQNKKNSYEHGYKLNYKISTDYPETDSYSSDYDSAIFNYEDIGESVYVGLELESNDLYKTLDEKLDTALTSAKNSTYATGTDSYRNFKITDIITSNINNKKVYYYIYQYDFYSEDKYLSTYYTSYIYYEIEEGYYLKVYIYNKNHEINEDLIKEFLDFTVEEY